METQERDLQLNLNSDTEEMNTALPSEIETDDEEEDSFERLVQRCEARRRAAQEQLTTARTKTKKDTFFPTERRARRKLLDVLSSDEELNVKNQGAAKMETTERDLHSDTEEMNTALPSDIETDDEEEDSLDLLMQRFKARFKARREAAQEQYSTERDLHSDTEENNTALPSETETDDEEEDSIDRLLQRCKARREAAQEQRSTARTKTKKDTLFLTAASLKAAENINLDIGDLDFDYNEELDEEEQIRLKARDEKFSEEGNEEDEDLSPRSSSFSEDLSDFYDELHSRFLKKMMREETEKLQKMTFGGMI
ncbi:hypothetical protein WMY93_011142 [Mugilogobius chulae]|uniref:Uncharacterized protein n=1 Tax=Mugilogobius chulae TaxID=88201 RepID=A0AAW0P7K3_9GOBI